MYGHVAQLARKEKEGVEKAGGKVDMYQYVHSSDAPVSLPKEPEDTGSRALTT